MYRMYHIFLCDDDAVYLTDLKERVNCFKWTWIKFVLLVVLWIFLFLYTNYISLPIPTVYITSLVYLALSFICYKGSWVRHFIAVTMCVLLLAIMDTLAIFTGTTLMQIDVERLYTQKHLYLTVATISKGLSLVIAWVCWRIQIAKSRWHIRVRWLLLTFLFPIVSLIMLVIVYENIQQGYDISSKTLGFTVAISLGNIAVMYLIHQLEKAEREALQSTLLCLW